MVDTETEEVLFKGEAQSPLKTINDLTQVSNQTAESMFGVNIADTQTAAAPMATQNAESATGAPSVAPAVTPTAAVSVTGDAKIADGADGGGEGDGTSFYFTPKYQSPVGTPVSWGGVNAEIGWVWRSGAVFGIDLSFGMDGDNILTGLGLSLGQVYKLRAVQMQVVCGAAGGFWLVSKYSDGYSYNFLAPFVKYRVSDFEVTYRGLMGIKEYGGFGYNSHQTMIGYQFRGATNKPKRSDSHPSDGEERNAAARKTKNGFSLGYVLSGDANTNIFQAGFAQSRPIGGTGLSFVWESNLLGGWGSTYNIINKEIFGAVGLNVPLLAQFDWSVLSVESGMAFDLLYRLGGDDYGEIYDETIFNAGFVVGGGLSLGPCRLSYRFNTGTRYYSQTVGVRFLF